MADLFTVERSEESSGVPAPSLRGLVIGRGNLCGAIPVEELDP